LLFAISFFLEPVIALTATVTIILLFSLQITNATTLQPFIALGSVGLFTPFAMFMIQQYRQAKNSAHNTSDLRKAVRRDVKAIAYILDQHANTIERAATHFQGDHELDIIKKNAQNLKQVVKQLQNQIEHE
jgi:ABC-type nickel/cobalt efflux system permease component RcnA